MTADDWASCTDPERMLTWLRDAGRLTDRKARLFCVAVCRRLWPLLADARSRAAVEAAEALADGGISAASRGRAVDGAVEATADLLRPADRDPSAHQAATAAFFCVATEADAEPYSEEDPFLYLIAEQVSSWAAEAVSHTRGQLAAGRDAQVAALWQECSHHCSVLRDLFGPHRPLLALDPSLLTWHGGVITQLAHACYEDRKMPEGTLDAGHLAVLCDVLEEAGADAGLVEHLRGGLHYRGCHVIDAILGRQ